ncbi:MAG: PDDEXK nuclease domain-containing protein, partial [Oscillospiraceae bacterium]|nr:PDDEXK nuclease domain-containing protein [Oscillospiraceae bacterium]
YLCFQKGGTPSHQLSWSHYYKLLSIKNESKRNYYINSAIEHSFSVRQLVEYIKTNAYERLIEKKNIKLKYIDDTKENELGILDMIKNPILITINNSEDKITEKALKKFMLEQIEKTMLELGVGFAYIGSEVPIRIDNKTLRPDLVFFNTELACYVIIELKLIELTIKDIGQIEFYVKYYDSNIKKPFYNPTIGITISKKINENVLKYNEKQNIKHSTYKIVKNIK